MKRKFAIVLMILLVSAVSVFAVMSTDKFACEDDNQSKSGAVCIIEGEYISKEYFEVRYNSYKNSPLDYENPKEETLQSLR